MPKIIAICNQKGGVGKTTTAISYARTVALSGRRTLLMDLDLRKPSIAPRLGIEPQTVLLDALSGRSDLQDLDRALSQEQASGLHVLPGGGRSDLPTDSLIASARLDQVLDHYRSMFDVIVLDTAPVLPVVDTLYLARHADLAAVLVRYAATNQRDVRRAADRLRGDMPPSAGILPIMSMEQRARRAYYYGGYYYGGYGGGRK